MFTNVYKMTSEKTISLATRIPKEHYEDILRSGVENTSEFVREAIKEKLTNQNLNFVNKNIKEKEKEIEFLESKKQLIKEKANQKKNIPKEELKWLSETNKLLNEKPEFFDGKYNQYLNIFPKSYNMSKQDFKALLNEALIQTQEKQVLKELEVT